MTNRQRMLYEYLVEKGDIWTKQADVAMDLYSGYGNAECYLAPELFHNTAERTLLTKDIRAINESEEAEKIIITSGRGVKIATEEEFSKVISRKYKAIFRKLARLRKMEKKGKAHNQFCIDGNAIDAFLKNFEEKP